MAAADQASVEAAATALSWPGLWGQARADGPLRADALAWPGEAVRRFAESCGQHLPDECLDAEDSPCPCTGAGAAWAAAAAGGRTPWWVDAQSHTEGPADDEDIPRKLEGWWRVLAYRRDGQQEVGEALAAGELCFVEKLWSDRVRVFRARAPQPLGEVPLERACDLQLMKARGTAVGSRWDLLRDVGEGGDDPFEIRVGQKLTLLGGEFGERKLQGMECEVKGYLDFMDRWSVEVPIKNDKGGNHVLAVLPSQLREARAPREPRPNGRVELSLAVRSRALELSFRGVEGCTLELGLRYVSRVRPGGRVWSTGSLYRYAEVRFVSSGNYGLVFRVLRMADPARRALSEDEEDPHLVLDVPHGSGRGAVAQAYRRLARRWHPDKVPEEERERAVAHFRRVHQAYENLLADPERNSDLMVLKMQRPVPLGKKLPVSIVEAFRTEVRCLTLVSQLRLPNVSRLVEVGPDDEFIVTWPYLPEALRPSSECDGLNQVNRVDIVRQGWSDYSRSRRAAQKVITMMVSVVRHDVMIVDPAENILVDRESGEPLMIDFGRGEIAGSIYTTRVKTFVTKVLSLLLRCVASSTFDVAAKFIRDVEATLFSELERWQDEKTRDQKKALALVASSTKWQEGIECCREIWNSEEDNPLRKMFKDSRAVLTPERALREARPAEDASSDDGSGAEAPAEDDDPEGLLDRDIGTLSPVELILRAKRKKAQRAKLPREKPNVKIQILETAPDGSLGLGLDDAPEDMRGVVIVKVEHMAEKYGFEVADRIVELNGLEIDEWDDFRDAWEHALRFSTTGVVFGIVREGVELPAEPMVPKCLHCGSKGAHLQKCSTWRPLPPGEACVHFCSRDCQREAWRSQKRRAAAAGE